MPPKLLTELFYRALFPFFDWEYSQSFVSENKLFMRGLVDKFIFQQLSEENQNLVIKTSKSNRMPIPPPLDAIIDIPAVKEQALSVIDIADKAESLQDLYNQFDNGVDMSEKFNDTVAKLLKVSKK